MPHNKTQIEQTRQRRDTTRTQGTYDVYIEIDCDCEELLDAVGLGYEEVEDDESQNEVCISLDKGEWDTFKQGITDDFASILEVNEQVIGAELLNYELGEYVTKVTIYKPDGDKITFE